MHRLSPLIFFFWICQLLGLVHCLQPRDSVWCHNSDKNPLFFWKKMACKLDTWMLFSVSGKKKKLFFFFLEKKMSSNVGHSSQSEWTLKRPFEYLVGNTASNLLFREESLLRRQPILQFSIVEERLNRSQETWDQGHFCWWPAALGLTTDPLWVLLPSSVKWRFTLPNVHTLLHME